MRDRQSGRLGYRGESLPLMSSPVRLQRLPTNVCTLRPAAAAYFAYIEERRDLSLVMGEIPKRNFPIQLTHDRFIFTSRNNNPKITKNQIWCCCLPFVRAWWTNPLGPPLSFHLSLFLFPRSSLWIWFVLQNFFRKPRNINQSKCVRERERKGPKKTKKKWFP
jgi:hypothetical protein